MIRTLCAALAALAAAGAFAQDPDFSKVEVRLEKLSPTVYMLTGAGGNLGLSAGDDGAFLVDDQFAPMTPKIRAAVASVTRQPLRFVLNTHWHFDHTGGNENLAREGAAIVAHANVRKRMSTDQVIHFLNAPVKASPRQALPVVTFTGDVTFHVNGDDVHVFHVPAAHTDGDAIVHFRTSDVIHMGDIYFNGFYPFIDADSGGTVDGTIAAVDRVLALAGDATRIIPGHGPLATKADLRAYRDMLATVAARIRPLAQAGRSHEQVMATKPTAEFDATWGKGFLAPERFVAMILRAYGGK